jgi:outer membrane protein insertion porin family
MEKFMIIIKTIRYTCLTLFFLTITFLSAANSQEVKKIIILPFEIYSRGDDTAIKDSLYKSLVEELKREKLVKVVPADAYLRGNNKYDKRRAIEIGKKTGVDFVVSGSLTRLGDSLSFDAQVIDVSKQIALSGFSAQGKGLADIGTMAETLKTEILSRAGLIQKIVKIEIKGNRKIEASAILQRIKSKVDKPYWESDISADIKTIFKMGFFLDVTADAISTPEGKEVTFTVQEKGLISDIQINGNKALSKDDIKEVLTVKVKQSLNQEKIKADVEKIKSLYETKGYNNVEITDKVEKDGEKDFKIIIDIKENDKIYVKSITFEGNEAYTSKELKNMMTSNEYTIFSFFSDSGVLKREQLKQDVHKINSYYFNNGYINSQVGEPEVTHDEKGIYIKITIKEGKRFKFGKIDVSGDSLIKPKPELLQALKIKEGNNYDRESLSKDMDFLTEACNDEGYAQADVNPRVSVRDKEQLVDIDFQIKKGELFYINRISVTGNTITRDKVVRRQLEVVEGSLYSSSNLKKSYSNLNRLRYFEEVDFQTEKRPDKNEMDINIRVKEKNTGMFMVGAGYSASEQAILMAQITQQNFLGYGQILSLKATMGGINTNYELSFTEPFLLDLPLWSQVNIWDYKRDSDSYTLATQGAGFTLGYPVWEKIVGYFGYAYTVNSIENINYLTAPDYIKDQELKRTATSVTLSLVRNTTDADMFPTKGTNSSISIQHVGGPLLGGNVKFTKYSAGVTAYYPLFGDVVFGAKGRIGYLQNNDDSDVLNADGTIKSSKLPLSERYVLGGISSLRGLRYVGIENSGTSDVLGGVSMFLLNLELVFPFIRDAGMKGVVFFDAGNTWDGAYLGYPDDLCATAGVGLRWYSPIGPLRLEYGYVLKRPKNSIDESAGRFEFTIGMFM